MASAPCNACIIGKNSQYLWWLYGDLSITRFFQRGGGSQVSFPLTPEEDLILRPLLWHHSREEKWWLQNNKICEIMRYNPNYPIVSQIWIFLTSHFSSLFTHVFALRGFICTCIQLKNTTLIQYNTNCTNIVFYWWQISTSFQHKKEAVKADIRFVCKFTFENEYELVSIC